MKIDNDLMDGDTTRAMSLKETNFVIEAEEENLVFLTHDNDLEEMFILGRQWERNQRGEGE